MRLLDDPALGPPERLRLIIVYLLYKDGLLEGDITKLMLHSQLRRMDERVFRSLELFGARVSKQLKDPSNRNRPQKQIQPPLDDEEHSDFSRFETALEQMLNDHVKGTLDPDVFPYTQPQMIPTGMGNGLEAGSQASLRSAKPTWARSRLSIVEPRQRIIVFMAGGATYSESRACYEVSKSSVRDVFLGSSHMLTPNFWLTQLGNMKEKRQKLEIPADFERKQVPQHLLEPDPVPKPAAPPPQARPAPAAAPAQRPAAAPPTKEMSGLRVHHQPKVPYYEQEAKTKKKKKFGFL